MTISSVNDKQCIRTSMDNFLPRRSITQHFRFIQILNSYFYTWYNEIWNIIRACNENSISSYRIDWKTDISCIRNQSRNKNHSFAKSLRQVVFTKDHVNHVEKSDFDRINTYFICVYVSAAPVSDVSAYRWNYFCKHSRQETTLCLHRIHVRITLIHVYTEFSRVFQIADGRVQMR